MKYMLIEQRSGQATSTLKALLTATDEEKGDSIHFAILLADRYGVKVDWHLVMDTLENMVVHGQAEYAGHSGTDNRQVYKIA